MKNRISLVIIFALAAATISIACSQKLPADEEPVIEEKFCQRNMEPPTNISSVSSDGKITLYWDRPVVGDCLLGYRVRYEKKGADGSFVQQVNPPSDTRYEWTNLLTIGAAEITVDNGEAYEFVVTAWGYDGAYGITPYESIWSQPHEAAADPSFSKLAFLRAAAGDGSVYLEWEEAAETAETKVLYNVYYAESGSPYQLHEIGEVAAQKTIRVISGLKNGVVYNFYIRKSGMSGKQGPAIAPFSLRPSGNLGDQFGYVTGRVYRPNYTDALHARVEVVSEEGGLPIAFTYTDTAKGNYTLALPVGEIRGGAIRAGFDVNGDGSYFGLTDDISTTDQINVYPRDLSIKPAGLIRSVDIVLDKPTTDRKIAGQISINPDWQSVGSTYMPIVEAVNTKTGARFRKILGEGESSYFFEVPAGRYLLSAGLDLNADGVVASYDSDGDGILDTTEPIRKNAVATDVTFADDLENNFNFSKFVSVAGLFRRQSNENADLSSWRAYAVDELSGAVFLAELEDKGSGDLRYVLDVMGWANYKIGIFDDVGGRADAPDQFDPQISFRNALNVKGDNITSNNLQIGWVRATGYSWRQNMLCVISEIGDSGEVIRSFTTTSASDGYFSFDFYQDAPASTYKMYLVDDLDKNGRPAIDGSEQFVYHPDGEFTIDPTDLASRTNVNLCRGCANDANLNPFADYVFSSPEGVELSALVELDQIPLYGNDWSATLEHKDAPDIVSEVWIPLVTEVSTFSFVAKGMAYGSYYVRINNNEGYSSHSPRIKEVELKKILGENKLSLAANKSIRFVRYTLNFGDKKMYAPPGWLFEVDNTSLTLPEYSTGRILIPPSRLVQGRSVYLYEPGTYDVRLRAPGPAPENWLTDSFDTVQFDSSNTTKWTNPDVIIRIRSVTGNVGQGMAGKRVLAKYIDPDSGRETFSSDATVDPNGDFTVEVNLDGDYNFYLISPTNDITGDYRVLRQLLGQTISGSTTISL